ncbi:uncharacterized protein LOC133797783 [Humulus lupulus]|uniref:uncharacterized protein LOC133797783 n=1 Tax=Humulus lupulus TaxID=3486 RepID=UPI002B40A2FE|nr:uncharacterized protein LOC133797783 [Humulus lupulus]XP_062091812.1 uncharacterized protein LOC133797783 [Humulus lupulus]XP_062091813.1 uncharacterized protein LOC133797783 [Humulus lupulus]
MNLPITFTEDDARNVHFSHHDPMVIDAQIANKLVSHVLVDDGSSVNLLFKPAFTVIGLTEADVASCPTLIYGFNGDALLPMGKIQLPVTLGSELQHSFKFCTFVVVDCPTAYNVIFGRPALVEFGAITSIRHLCMKFPCDNGGVGTVRGDQKSARKCYHVSARSIYMVRDEPVEDFIDLLPPPPTERVVQEEDDLDPRIGDDRALEPMDEIDEVCISDTDPTRIIQVRKSLPADVRAAIIAQVKENQDILAWSHSNMTGIDRNIIWHALSIDPNATPVRQKRKPLGTERAEALKLEVEKLSSINFIREDVYPIWLANPVLVPKPNGTWRMCIDFTDLNKACPKDCFPLPRIDQMVDATSGYEILSFKDAYSGYNQISMHVADQEHTSFQTDKGIYCYIVMPFGLKNVGQPIKGLSIGCFGPG